jgi:glutathione S-transferase
MSSEELTLWGAGTVRQLRPHWMLAEMGLDYEFIAVLPRSGETYDPEFLKINPRHKIPVLRHRKFIPCESAAILQYLSEAFEAPPGFHVPINPVARARVNEWCFFIMSELDAHALYVIRRHTDLKNLYGEAPTASCLGQHWTGRSPTAFRSPMWLVHTASDWSHGQLTNVRS